MTSTPTGSASRPAARARSRPRRTAGHGANANIFTSIVVTYTDNGGSGGAGAADRARRGGAPAEAQAGRVLRRARAASPAAPRRATPACRRRRRRTPAAARTSASSRTATTCRTPRSTSRTSRELRLPRGLRRRRRQRSRCASTRRPATLVGTSPTITPTGGWQNWTTIAMPIANPPAGTHELFFVFTHPTDDGRAVQPQLVPASSARVRRVSAPPEVSATATPDDRHGAARGHVRRDGDRRRGRDLTYRVGLRRHRHHRPTRRPAGPDVHVRAGRDVHGDASRSPTRRASRATRDRPGARHRRRPVPAGQPALGRVRGQGAGRGPLDRVAAGSLHNVHGAQRAA